MMRIHIEARIRYTGRVQITEHALEGADRWEVCEPLAVLPMSNACPMLASYIIIKAKRSRTWQY